MNKNIGEKVFGERRDQMTLPQTANGSAPTLIYGDRIQICEGSTLLRNLSHKYFENMIQT